MSASVTDVAAEREAHGRKPLKTAENQKGGRAEAEGSQVIYHGSYSGYMHRDGKPKGFFYLDHRTVESEHALITDDHVTPGNVHDSVPKGRS